MSGDSLVYVIFLIFAGAAVLATVALYTRQSLLVVYILLGILFGPWGLQQITNAHLIEQMSEVGIIFLLFLLGLHLHPQKLWHMMRTLSWIAVVSSVIFALVGFGVAHFFGYTLVESGVIGAAMVFSSTIISLKLLPTTVLHHQHVGELMIGILLLQDLFAIIALLLVSGMKQGGLSLGDISVVLLYLPALALLAFLAERYVLLRLISRFEQVREYVFLLAIGWCVGIAELAASVGLTSEVGAFIAGVTLATSPVSRYIAESLKPLRDFFLVMFFFSIGASFNLDYLPQILWPALTLGILMLLLKPLVFRQLFCRAGESSRIGWEVGLRLGQVSEFSLLVAYLASAAAGEGAAIIGENASYTIQAATILSFIVSSYLVVLRYPTPMALTDRMRCD